MALAGAAGAAGCLGGGGDDGEADQPATTGRRETPTRLPGPGETGTGESLPSALQVVSAVGVNVDERRIGTVELTVGKADWVEEVDLTALDVDWTTPTDSYDLAAQSSDRSADGYFGIEPVRGTAADATLTTPEERHRLVFDLGTDDTNRDDRHRQREDDSTYFGEVLREDDVVGLRLTTAGGSTTTVRLLAPDDVMEIEGTVELPVR